MRPRRAMAILIGTLPAFVSCATTGGGQQPQHQAIEDENKRRAMKYFIKAKVYERQGNYLGAIVALRNAADLDETPTIYAQLARNYERTQDLDMAIAFARKSIAMHPEQTDLRYHLIRWLDSTGKRLAAADELEDLLVFESDSWPLYSHLARILLETGQKKRLADLFDDLMDRTDTPTEVRVNVAYIFSRRGDRPRARKVFEEVLRTEPATEDAWIGLAEIEIAEGAADKAIALYRLAIRALPESSLINYELARLMKTPADLQLLLEEKDPSFLYRLGVALAEMERDDLAVVVFERIVGLPPITAEGWLDPARYYVQREDYAGAGRVLEKASAAMPDSVKIYLFWGTVMERAERYDEAARVYERGLERLADDVELYLYWGFSLEQRQMWDEAIEVYKRGVVATEADSELYIRWGIVNGRQERWQEALGRYRKAVVADSLNAEAYLHWGIALEKLDHWEEAIEKLTLASSLDTHDTYSLFYLGSCLEQAAKARGEEVYFERAIETFKKLIEKSPNDAYALNYLGYMYAERGIHLQEAVVLLRQAIALDPENGAFFDSLGWAYYRQGELEQAEHFLAKALEQLPEHEEEEQAIIYDHAGDVAHTLGKADEAAHHWQSALDLVPDDEDVLRKLSNSGSSLILP